MKNGCRFKIKKIGINKSAYDIFFVNSKGVRVDAGKGSQISVMSRDRLKDINVYKSTKIGVKYFANIISISFIHTTSTIN